MSSLIFATVFYFLIQCQAVINWPNSAPFHRIREQLQSHSSIDIVDDFLTLRAGQHGRTEGVVWHFSGTIRSLSSGNEIVGIEGIEFIRRLAGDRVAKITNTSQGSYISKKIFVYSNLHNRSDLVTSFKVNPIAPVRTVNPVKQLSEIVTIGSSIKPVKQSPSRRNSDIAIEVHKPSFFSKVEWPGGRVMETKKINLKRNRINGDSKSWADPFLYKQEINVVHFIKGARPKSVSKWISFAGQSDEGGRSHEQYSLSSAGWNKLTKALLSPMSTVKATMKYTRTGEGPHWCSGVGRTCITDLTGRRYDKVTHVPKNIRKLLCQHYPEFFEGVWYPSVEEFHSSEVDIYSQYKPWYSILNPWKAQLRKQTSTQTHR